MPEIKADYCLILCIDYRIQQTFYDWVNEHHLFGKADIIEIAGSSRDIAKPATLQDKAEILRNLAISVKLHNPKNIFIFDHQDCGAYAADTTIVGGQELVADLNQHKPFMLLAKEELQGLYPEINVQTFYISLDHKVIPL